MGNMRRYGAPGNPETDEGREQRSGLIILQRSKDLMKYLYTSFVKYPRSEKLGFVADYKKCLFQFLILIITAQKKYFKKTTLQDADVQLELLRMFNDLSYDMKFVDEKRYILVSEKLCEIGRLDPITKGNQHKHRKIISGRGNRSKTLADCLWQLQQHFERWPFRVELEQPTFERQDEHRLLLRLSF